MKRITGWADKPNRLLVISYGGVGDLLLTTPLIKSLRRAYPDSEIDLYVQKGRESIFEGNPDISNIFTSGSSRGLRASLDFLCRFAMKYDLAVSTRWSDRQILYARAAGKKAVSMIPPLGQNRWWKKRVLSGWVSEKPDVHVADNMLELANVLSIPRCRESRPPQNLDSESRIDASLPFSRAHQPYGVIHLSPRNHYKDWTRHGWRCVIRDLDKRGLKVVIISGPGKCEARMVNDVLKGLEMEVCNLSGKLSLADVAALLKGSALYVGLDTATSHLAAVLDVPSVVLAGKVLPQYLPYRGGLNEKPYELVSDRVWSGGSVTLVTGGCACGAGRQACANAPEKMGYCMAMIKEERVLKAIDGQCTCCSPASLRVV